MITSPCVYCRTPYDPGTHRHVTVTECTGCSCRVVVDAKLSAIEASVMELLNAECERLKAENASLTAIVRACARADTRPSSENDAALQLAEDWVKAHPEPPTSHPKSRTP